MKFHLKMFLFTSNTERSICSCFRIHAIAGSNPFIKFNYVLSEMEVSGNFLNAVSTILNIIVILIYNVLMSLLYVFSVE